MKKETTYSDFLQVIHGIEKQYPFPSYTLKSFRVSPGEKLTLTPRDYTIYNVNYVTTKFEKENPELIPVKAIFLGRDKPIYTKANYNKKEESIEITVPKNVTDGYLLLEYDIKENFGTQEHLESINPDKSILTHEFGVVELKRKYDDDLCRYIELDPGELIRISSYQQMIGTLQVKCGECPIHCPYDAIKIDPLGQCTVDKQLCQGQYYTISYDEFDEVDGRLVFKRSPENSCWECFNERDSAYSTKCLRGRLRKVPDLSATCCGDCKIRSQVYGMQLIDLCPVNAIYRESIGPYLITEDGEVIEPTDESGGFAFDYGLCNGCMNCYYGINCYNNGVSGNLRMVAFMDEPRNFMHLEILNIKVTEIRGYQLHPLEFDILAVSDAETQTVIPTTLNPDGSMVLEPHRIDFREFVQFALVFRGDEPYRLINLRNQGLRLPFRTAWDIDYGTSYNRREVRFPLQYGTIIVEYHVWGDAIAD